MTLLGSALTLAQALTSAVVGWIAEEVSLAAAMAVPAVAGVIVLGLGILNAAASRRAPAASRRAPAACVAHTARETAQMSR